jgi:micrococcal nuclease
LLQESDQIQLEMDKNASYDAYDRLLGWIWIDDELLQSKLVETGLAKVAYLYDEYKYTSKLQALQQQAQQNKLKLWSQ